MKRNDTWLKWTMVSVAVLPLFLFSLQTSSVQVASAVQNNTSESENELLNKETELTKEKLISITDQFMDMLVQETDQSYKVKAYNTKKELLNDFQSVSTIETAKEYVDFYYKEKEEDLYIVPTSRPPWFQNENNYALEQLSKNHVRIVQENESDLHGNYKLTLELKYDQQWRITKIKHE